MTLEIQKDFNKSKESLGCLSFGHIRECQTVIFWTNITIGFGISCPQGSNLDNSEIV